MHLTSLPTKGSTDPILLLLADSSTHYSHTLLKQVDWDLLVAKGEAGPPSFPFGSLPTLSFGHGARGGNDTVIGELSAILALLESKLSPAGSIIRAPDAIARLEMLRSASTNLLNHILHLSTTSPDWLAPPNRAPLEVLCTTYLTSLSHHLSSSFFPPLLSNPLPLGQPGSNLTAAAVMVATTVTLVEDVFPGTLGRGEGGMKERWPAVEKLRQGVEGRDKVRTWREGRNTVESGWEWAEGEWATRAFMRDMSVKWDSEDAAEAKFGELVDVV